MLCDRGERGECSGRAHRDVPHERRGGRDPGGAEVHRRVRQRGSGKERNYIFIDCCRACYPLYKVTDLYPLIELQAVGMLFKRGSTISAAEGGCQAEVGGMYMSCNAPSSSS